MVGVPGKFKGCEPCRLRRVPCDNQHPVCGRCVRRPGGPECVWTRPLVFINGTPEGKGRVSIHPKRSISAPSAGVSKRKFRNTSPPMASAGASPHLSPNPASPLSAVSSPASVGSAARLSPTMPSTSPAIFVSPAAANVALHGDPETAWADTILLASRGLPRRVCITALNTKLKWVVKSDLLLDCGSFALSFPPYSPADAQHFKPDGFEIPSQCFLSLSLPESSSSTAFCVFLFEIVSVPRSLLSSSAPSSPATVRMMGPDGFWRFPNHHYFVRVLRPLAITTALLRREETFLSSTEWRTIPWLLHPKGAFDDLLDIISVLPAYLSRCDQVLSATATSLRRLQVQELMADCQVIQSHFDAWFSAAVEGSGNQMFLPWQEAGHNAAARLPFLNRYVFRDGVAAVMFLYYWMAQIPFHSINDRVYEAILEPVADPPYSVPVPVAVEPSLPTDLLADSSKYRQGRVFADNICRALDFALATTTQPDLLLAPLAVVYDLYATLRDNTPGEAALELLWCESMRARLTLKGDEMAHVIQSKAWWDVGRV